MIAFIFTTGNAQWEAVGPYGGPIRSAAVSYTDENLVYVMSRSYPNPSNVAKSTDGGATWTSGGVMSGEAYCMAIDPINSDKIYTGGPSAMWRSTDGGATWISIPATNYYIYGLAVDIANPSNVYASGTFWSGTKWLVCCLKSTDSGVNWTTAATDTNGGCGYNLAIDRTNPDIIYICGCYNMGYVRAAIYKSTDAGNTWVLKTSGIPSNSSDCIMSIAVHPTDPNILYAGGGVIYRSSDAGNTWTQVANHGSNNQMVTSPASPDIAYVSGYMDVYKTTDAGNTWFIADSGLPDYMYYGLAISQSDANKVFVGNKTGVFKTTNGGSNWTNTNNNLRLGTICSFCNAPSAPSTIYTSFAEVAVFKTTNDGASWTQFTNPITCNNICQFAVDYANPDNVYCLQGIT